MHTAPLRPGENAWCWNPITNSNSRANQFTDTATRLRCITSIFKHQRQVKIHVAHLYSRDPQLSLRSVYRQDQKPNGDETNATINNKQPSTLSQISIIAIWDNPTTSCPSRHTCPVYAFSCFSWSQRPRQHYHCRIRRCLALVLASDQIMGTRPQNTLLRSRFY